MMSHFDKLEQFHKSIRKQELKNFFSHKRIQLLNSHECTSIDEEVNFQDINTATLKHLAIICQTEQGIDKICNLRVEQQLEKYLASEYINTNEQIRGDMSFSSKLNVIFVVFIIRKEANGNHV